MPIYEFKCKKCGNIFEYLCLKKNDKNQACCPACGHEETEVLLSTFSSMNSGKAHRGGNEASSSSCSPSSGFS